MAERREGGGGEGRARGPCGRRGKGGREGGGQQERGRDGGEGGGGVGGWRGARPDVDGRFSSNDKHGFCGGCDVIMNSLPLTEKTRGFLGAPEFAAMKPGVIVINTGRGATIDTDALLDALGSGQVGAALLDVTDPEPLPADHPLWTAPNVFITPHYSGAHPTYDERANAIFLDNLRRFLAGEPLRNVVDKREGYCCLLYTSDAADDLLC